MDYRSTLLLFFLLALIGCEDKFYVNPHGKDLVPQSGPGSPEIKPEGKLEKKLVPYIKNEQFNGNNQQKLDLLMVVDNSGSMGEEIQSVKEQLGNFTQRLQARRAVDYQIAFTTTNYVLQTRPGIQKLQVSTKPASQGAKVVKSEVDLDPVQQAKDIIESIPIHTKQDPVNYSGWEMGILSAKDTIESVGSDFMRDRTDLAVITISDEDDHSEPRCSDPNNADCRLYAVEDVVCPLSDGSCPYLDLGVAKTFFQDLGRSVLYQPLVGLPDPECSTVWSIGNRYVELAQLLGFQAQDICVAGSPSPLEANLLAIADSISVRGLCFPLTEKATGQAIEVTIISGSGVPVVLAEGPDGYQFNAPTNAICFPASRVFDGSSSVSVSYQSLRYE